MTPAQVATVEASGLRKLVAAFAPEVAFTGDGFAGRVVYGALTAECRLTAKNAVLVFTISSAGVVTSALVDDGGVLKTLADPTLDPAVAALAVKVDAAGKI